MFPPYRQSWLQKYQKVLKKHVAQSVYCRLLQRGWEAGLVGKMVSPAVKPFERAALVVVPPVKADV